MQSNICSQCNETATGPSNRIVKDSCGHKKCRVCLLEDEVQCKLCVKDKLSNGDSKPSDQTEEIGVDLNGKNQEEVLVNNHTAVIQLNGNAYSNANQNGLNTVPRKLYDCIENVLETSAQNKNSLPTQIENPEKDKKRPYNLINVPEHITITSDPLSYHCDICDKSFITKTHIKYHSYCVGGSKPFKCEVCNKEFILRAQLDVHSYKHKSSKPFSCSVCKKSFSVQSKLTRHSSVHSVVKSHICSVCGNAYRSKESLKIHSIIHKGDKPFGCKFCSSKFSNQSNLAKHMTVHSKEKAHMCDQCGKRFKLKWALTVHRRSHIRTRPHKCEICFKTFVNNKDLQRHRYVHNDTKPFMCSICSISFRRQDNLRRHMKNTHPGKKGEVIKNVVILPSENACTSTITKKTPIDNPNAIKVITTASPAFTSSKAEGQTVTPPPFVKSDCRAGEETSVINRPIKLASKTPAFKSNYNISRYVLLWN
nr:putative zinc finger protein 840 isoform X1 [Leptinotarsa decemlineata]